MVYVESISFSLCLRVCVSSYSCPISVVSQPIKLKLGGEIQYTHISILRKIHNDSFHDLKKKQARSNEQKQT